MEIAKTYGREGCGPKVSGGRWFNRPGLVEGISFGRLVERYEKILERHERESKKGAGASKDRLRRLAKESDALHGLISWPAGP